MLGFAKTRDWVYPQSIDGRFMRLRKKTFLGLHLLLLIAPLITIGGRPAVQIDIPGRRVFLLGAIFTPYDTIFLLLLALFLIDGDSWITPNMTGWLLMGLAGICSAIAWIGFINGYRGSSPAILAPFEYIALIGGAIAGYLIWDEVPDRWVVVGAATIIASGLYVVYREIGLKRPAD